MTRSEYRTTRRRSSAERQLATKIDNLAAGKVGDPATFAQAELMTAAAVRSHRFEQDRSYHPGNGLPTYHFHDVGESLTGILGEAETVHEWRAAYYPVKLDDGRVLYIPGNRRLVKLIKTTHAIGLRVKITYLGKFKKYGPSYEKVYSIKLVPFLKSQKPAVPKETKADTPIPVDEAKVLQILEDAAAGGNKAAQRILDRKRSRAQKEGK
jgi:hypothetical protein